MNYKPILKKVISTVSSDLLDELLRTVPSPDMAPGDPREMRQFCVDLGHVALDEERERMDAEEEIDRLLEESRREDGDMGKTKPITISLVSFSLRD